MGSRSDSNQDTSSSLLPSLFSHFLFKKKKVCFTDVAVVFCVECQSSLEQQVRTMLLHELEVRFQWQGSWEGWGYPLLFISNMNLRNCDLHENSNTRICPIYKINLTVSPTLTIVVLHSALGFSFFVTFGCHIQYSTVNHLHFHCLLLKRTFICPQRLAGINDAFVVSIIESQQAHQTMHNQISIRSGSSGHGGSQLSS